MTTRKYRHTGKVTAYTAADGNIIVRWHTANGEHIHSDYWPKEDFEQSFVLVEADDEGPISPGDGADAGGVRGEHAA